MSVSSVATSLSGEEEEGERRPIRPVERMPMKTWLLKHLDQNTFQTLTWTNKELAEFKIAWCHGARQGWNRTYADIFCEYAKLTGRYVGYEKDTKKWKANFRSALHSLKDVEEIKEKTNKRGGNAFRAYRFLNTEPAERKAKRASKRWSSRNERRKPVKRIKKERLSSCSDSDIQNGHLPEPLRGVSSPPNLSLPSQERLSDSMSIASSPLSPASCTIKTAWNLCRSTIQNTPDSCLSEPTFSATTQIKNDNLFSLTEIPVPQLKELPYFEKLMPDLEENGFEYEKMRVNKEQMCGYMISRSVKSDESSKTTKIPTTNEPMSLIDSYKGSETPAASPEDDAHEEGFQEIYIQLSNDSETMQIFYETTEEDIEQFNGKTTTVMTFPNDQG